MHFLPEEPYSENLGRLASGDGDDSDKEMIRDGMSRKRCHCLHPGRLTWDIQITHLERKMIFQTSMILFHVNLPGCNCQPTLKNPLTFSVHSFLHRHPFCSTERRILWTVTCKTIPLRMSMSPKVFCAFEWKDVRYHEHNETICNKHVYLCI